MEVLKLQVHNRRAFSSRIREYYVFPHSILVTKSFTILILTEKLIDLDFNLHTNPISCSSMRVLHLCCISFVGGADYSEH